MSYLNQLLPFVLFVGILMLALIVEEAWPYCRPTMRKLSRMGKDLQFAIVSRYLALRMWITATLAPRIKSLRTSRHFRLRHR